MARAAQARPDIQVFAEISAVDQLVTRAMERSLPRGLSRAQFNLLTRLAQSEEVSPAQLADDLGLGRPAISYLIGGLVRTGLVSVKSHRTDGRRKHVHLTDAGVERLAEAERRLASVAAALRQALSPDEFTATLPLLTRLRRHLVQSTVQD